MCFDSVLILCSKPTTLSPSVFALVRLTRLTGPRYKPVSLSLSLCLSLSLPPPSRPPSPIPASWIHFISVSPHWLDVLSVFWYGISALISDRNVVEKVFCAQQNSPLLRLFSFRRVHLLSESCSSSTTGRPGFMNLKQHTRVLRFLPNWAEAAFKICQSTWTRGNFVKFSVEGIMSQWYLQCLCYK